MESSQRKKLLLFLLFATLLALSVLLIACKGPQGEKGQQGIQGLQGPDGSQGETGPQGPAGELALVTPGPGVDVEITGVTIGADRKPVISFSVKDEDGNPLDAADLGFVIGTFSTIKVDSATSLTSFFNYYTHMVPGAPYVFEGEEMTPTLTEAEQAWFSGAFPGTPGTWTGDDGEFTFTFDALPADYDATATHRAGIAVRRGEEYGDNDTYDFIPAGGQVTVTRDIVQTANCNQCHDPLTPHGGIMRDTKMCQSCHTSQNTDPDTGQLLEYKRLIHKIHKGAELPSVEAGTPFYIVGFGQTAFDFSTIEWPQDIRNCTTCHKGVAQSDNYKTAPSRTACGACHDDVDFAAGTNHPGGVQTSDAFCALCHQSTMTSEFDQSIPGAHTIPENSTQVPGINFEIVSVDNRDPGDNPTVVFNVTDDAGTAVDPTTMGYLAATLAGPTTDYANRWTEIILFSPAIAWQGTGPDEGNYSYTFLQNIPTDATGTYAVGMEGFKSVSVDYPVTEKGDMVTEVAGDNVITVRDAGFNPVFYVAVTDATAQPRREVVARENCNQCHLDIGNPAGMSIHGGVRRNTEYCVLCHNPNHSDVAQRPADEMPPATVHFKRMIHQIHTGEEQTEDVVIYGFGGTKFDFSEVRFPGDRRNCEKCHKEGTYELNPGEGVLGEGVLPTTITWTVDGEEQTIEIPPVTSACTACHDTAAAEAHAWTMTGFDLEGDAAEACVVCHGEGRGFAVSEVHERWHEHE